MKIRMRMLVLSLAVAFAGLTFSACEKEEPAAPAEETEVEQPLEEEAAEEETAEEEEAREYDEDMYILAAFEVTCVNAQIEDPAQASEIKNEIYARYGFEDADDFAKAEEAIGGRDTVQRAIDSRMEECNAELAASFAEAGAEPAAAEEEASEEATEESAQRPAPAPKKTPPFTGRLQGTTSGSGIDNGEIDIQVRADFNVRGNLTGSREGRDFNIRFTGKADESGGFTATGERNGNTVNIRGRLTSNSASGDINANIFQSDVRATFQAR